MIQRPSLTVIKLYVYIFQVDYSSRIGITIVLFIQGVKIKVSNLLRGCSTHQNKKKGTMNMGPEMHTF